MDNRVEILASNYPLQTLLEQNDLENRVVVQWLVDEGYVNLNDYFYEDMEMIEDEE